MSRFFAFVGATVGGALGWWVATPGGLMWQYMSSVVGTAIGVYLGRRVADRLS
jgi:uncharacterized membrane protein YfcA